MSRRSRPRSPKARRASEARRADRYALYEKSVQEPDADIHLIRRVFRKHTGRPPRLLREDFCGTALLACRWVEQHEKNRAWAIDLDPQPLAWGRQHNVAPLRPEQAARVKLIEGDVRDIGHEKVDVTVAFNFSYFLFKTRSELRYYLETARATLKDDGMLMLDAYGGADSQRTSEEERPVGRFTYVWDQHLFDPITHSVLNYIHFEFKDGSRIRRAFAYDWRLWTLPEIRDLLIDVGFRRVEVYWENTDSKTGEGNNVFTRRERAIDDPAWIAYIVALP
ncbi:MAG: class I SAM-dependent methyltransferase [Myxococcales bacterium]|nr:class I SAM-dependent methyltransferase [Myxococcales bacterium]